MKRFIKGFLHLVLPFCFACAKVHNVSCVFSSNVSPEFGAVNTETTRILSTLLVSTWFLFIVLVSPENTTPLVTTSTVKLLIVGDEVRVSTVVFSRLFTLSGTTLSSLVRKMVIAVGELGANA